MGGDAQAEQHILNINKGEPDLAFGLADPQLSEKLKMKKQTKLDALIAELESTKARLEREITVVKSIQSVSNRTGITPIPLISAAEGLDVLSSNYLSKRLGLGTQEECSTFFKELVEKSAQNQWLRIKPGPLVDFFISNNLVDHKLDGDVWVKMW